METMSASLDRAKLTSQGAASGPPSAGSWGNWDGRQECTPASFERPATVSELSGALERAQRAGRRVRVAGAGHSFTGLVVTDGTLISLERMLADGSMLTLDAQSDPETWRAARVSLGALGVVTAMTLEVVPAFRLRG